MGEISLIIYVERKSVIAQSAASVVNGIGELKNLL